MPSNLVVRTYAPARRVLVIAGSIILGLLTLYLAFELGRQRAGFDAMDELRRRAELNGEIKNLQETNRQLRVQLAGLETARIGQGRERAEISRTIGELQAQIARQSQELSFYRGIVGKAAPSPGIEIQRLRIFPGTHAGQFRLSFSLVRATRTGDTTTGMLAIKVIGQRREDETILDLAALAPGGRRELPFRVRYFQNFEQEITLPEQFRPERLTVELRSRQRGGSPLVQSFLWTVDGA
jgi:hypothetical protein